MSGVQSFDFLFEKFHSHCGKGQLSEANAIYQECLQSDRTNAENDDLMWSTMLLATNLVVSGITSSFALLIGYIFDCIFLNI